MPLNRLCDAAVADISKTWTVIHVRSDAKYTIEATSPNERKLAQ